MRLLVLMLMLANGLYFAWSQGLLRAYGLAPVQQTEPQRLEQQIRPEALRILPSAEAKRLDEQARVEHAPKECLLAGPLDDIQALALRKVLEADWPEASWQIEVTQLPERWILYMGKFPDPAALAKKRAELSALNLALEPVHNPDLEPGFSLGAFPTKEAAAQALERLLPRGVRTARVVQEQAKGATNQLRLPAVSEALRQRLGDIRSVLADRVLRPCSESAR